MKWKPLGGPVGEDCGCERPERFPELDVAVEPPPHVGIARVGEDAATAERSRPELGGALKPADDAAGRQHLGDHAAQFIIALVTHERHAGVPQRSGTLVFGVRRAEQRAALAVRRRGGARLVQQAVRDVQGAAKRAARVAGGRLRPDFRERSFLRQAGVGDAVEGHAAGQAQSLLPRDRSAT